MIQLTASLDILHLALLDIKLLLDHLKKNSLIYVHFLLGKRGNLTEQTLSVVWSLLISIVSLFGCIYLILWQTYVLRLEVVICAIQLGFIGIEMIFGIISAISFAR